ncbi:MAG: hypothetical protein LQ343_000778 [Gyalolechia ehrenbergii]|nr:MAG: hypothetical protein LQ343_000778 [Gyalolechia ehrenbergii]
MYGVATDRTQENTISDLLSSSLLSSCVLEASTPARSINVLPNGNLVMILKCCIYKTFNNLRRTNSTFDELSDWAIQMKDWRKQILVNTDSSQHPASYQLADNKKQDSKRRGGEETHKRMCLLCGFDEAIHKPGDMVTYWKLTQYIYRDGNCFSEICYNGTSALGEVPRHN